MENNTLFKIGLIFTITCTMIILLAMAKWAFIFLFY